MKSTQERRMPENESVSDKVDQVPSFLYLPLTEHRAQDLFQTGTLTWEKALIFIEASQIPLPRLLTGTFQELRDIFFHHFISNPKSQEVIAQQDQWRVDIAQEFQKNNGGVFENLIQTMVRTNQVRHEKLKTLYLLRLFKKPYKERQGISEAGTREKKICVKLFPHLIDETLFKSLVPVVYTDVCPPSLEEKIFLRGMFGPEWVQIESLYRDLFGVRSTALSYQEEVLLFAHHASDRDLKMALREGVFCQNDMVCPSAF